MQRHLGYSAINNIHILIKKLMTVLVENQNLQVLLYFHRRTLNHILLVYKGLILMDLIFSQVAQYSFVCNFKHSRFEYIKRECCSKDVELAK